MTKPRRPRAAAPQVSDVVWAMLTDGELPEQTDENGWDFFIHTYHRRSGELEGPAMQDYWGTFGPGVLEDWIDAHPGTRPSCWWEFTAPEPKPEGESEAAYLDRHGLLLPGERERMIDAR